MITFDRCCGDFFLFGLTYFSTFLDPTNTLLRLNVDHETSDMDQQYCFEYVEQCSTSFAPKNIQLLVYKITDVLQIDQCDVPSLIVNGSDCGTTLLITLHIASTYSDD